MFDYYIIGQMHQNDGSSRPATIPELPHEVDLELAGLANFIGENVASPSLSAALLQRVDRVRSLILGLLQKGNAELPRPVCGARAGAVTYYSVLKANE